MSVTKTPTTLPPIEFGGKIIKARSGFYRCPFSCGDKRYPARTWKTEKGFRKHLEECPKSPTAIERQKQQESTRRAELIKKRDAALAELKYDVGDTIFFVREVIVKPTHVRRGDRLVRVRYEEVKRFDARQETIETIGYDGDFYFNDGIRISQLCSSIEEAQALSQSRQKSWDDHVEFSMNCR